MQRSQNQMCPQGMQATFGGLFRQMTHLTELSGKQFWLFPNSYGNVMFTICLAGFAHTGHLLRLFPAHLLQIQKCPQGLNATSTGFLSHSRHKV